MSAAAIPLYSELYARYDAAAAMRADMGAAPFNAAVLSCDRHCGANRTALRWSGKDGRSADYSFETLRDRSERFAAVLADLGVGANDRVACLLPRTPELLVVLLAAWRLGAVYQPLFTAFGPKAIEHRVQTSGAKVIVTDAGNRGKLGEVKSAARIVTIAGAAALAPGDLDFEAELQKRAPGLKPVPRGPDDPFLIMFTSGTTGPSKPVVVPMKALASFIAYMRFAVDLRADDVFWNIADPGWAYGLWYAVTAPLAMGAALTFYDGPFTVESTVATVKRYGVTNLAGAPTAYRMIVAAGPEAVGEIKGRLRAVSSAGEPLNPEVIRWFAEHLGVVIHDHYGQTEVGMTLCNHHALRHPVHAGAAGVSVPGFRVAVVDEATGRELGPGAPGVLAVDRQHSPAFWFAGYDSLPTPALGPRYYLSGDIAEMNADGSISFVGRADDVITSAGYRIGPFDVESALVEHPAVAEAAAIGKPDAERTEIVKAFVILKSGFVATPKLADELSAHVKRRLSAHAYPREVEFVESLPKTPSGKIQRFILRNQEIAKTSGG